MKDYVIVKYEGEHWPGVVTKICISGITVTCMSRNGNYWKWPTQEDTLIYELSDDICKINQPKKVSSKRKFF